MTRTRFEGAMTALVTPMRDGAVDYDALTQLVEWQIASGIDAIVAVGTTGESATLDVDEHIAVVGHCVKAARGRVPIIAGAVPNPQTLSPSTSANATQSVTQTASGIRIEMEDLQS